MKYITEQEFAALEKRVAILEGSEDLKAKKTRPQSPKEFILAKDPKGEAETAVCLIYFCEEIENNSEGINSGDLKEKFKDAREKAPKNPADVLSKCARKGWIHIVDEKSKPKKWMLTNTGTTHVNNLGESQDE